MGKDGYNLLWKYNELVNQKQMVVKNIIRRTLGKNDADLGRGLVLMRENHIRRKTFVQCRTLYRTLIISDRCIDMTYRTYWKLLITFRSMNPWTARIVASMTKNPAVNQQIAFWRMRDTKTNNMRFPPNTIVKLKRMFEVVKTHYTMQTARSFWKIDRCDQDPGTMDSSFMFNAKFAAQKPKEDFDSDMYSANSFAKQTPARTFGNKGAPAKSSTNLLALPGKGDIITP